MKRAMNMSEYTKALSKLPFNYKVLPAETIQVCFFKSDIILCSIKEKPIIFTKGAWEILKFQPLPSVK